MKVYGISKNNLKNLLLLIPPKEEQKAIAQTLSDVDSLINSINALVTKKRQIKQGVMQQLLTCKTGLPGFKDEGRLINLGDFFRMRSGRTPTKNDEIVTFIGMEDISIDGKIINQHAMHFKDIRPGLTYFEKNDILVAKITPCFENGKGACLSNLATHKGFGSTEFHVLVANESAISEYIFYYTQTVKFRKKLSSEMVGTAGHKRIPSSSIIDYPLPILHSKEEQKAIAQALCNIDAEIECLERQLQKTKNLKQGMMQQLLTGKMRLI